MHIRTSIRSGSSPRTWGTHVGEHHRPLLLRFIPTYMGNTGLHRRQLLSFTVHPHVHGEHSSIVRYLMFAGGSSPRTWGTPTAGAGQSARTRFIPTYMGNTHALAVLNDIMAVHPHVHGEHSFGPRSSLTWTGSSPRTWGTPGPSTSGTAGNRFIPTYMGNTVPHGMRSAISPVHPHVHGEHDPRPRKNRRTGGSSPRTWGTLHEEGVQPPLERFIPTYMGNTSQRVLHSLTLPVHPHVHGEHLPPGIRVGLQRGSSPRTWGTLEPEDLLPPVVRFIPTYMGNTSSAQLRSLPQPVHPHVHGEH